MVKILEVLEEYKGLLNRLKKPQPEKLKRCEEAIGLTKKTPSFDNESLVGIKKDNDKLLKLVNNLQDRIAKKDQRINKYIELRKNLNKFFKNFNAISADIKEEVRNAK